MTSEFEFHGGLWKPAVGREVKFLCFMLVGGEEVGLFPMKKNGLIDTVVRDPENTGDLRSFYSTTVSNVAKIFVHDVKNDQRRFYSFYFKIKGKGAPLVTIYPFPDVTGEDMTKMGYFFRARGSFLSKNDALAVLSADSPSRGYLQSQRLLPIPVLQAMVHIDRNVLREGVRVVRIGNKTT